MDLLKSSVCAFMKHLLNVLFAYTQIQLVFLVLSDFSTSSGNPIDSTCVSFGQFSYALANLALLCFSLTLEVSHNGQFMSFHPHCDIVDAQIECKEGINMDISC